jgi:hypothetical protein
MRNRLPYSLVLHYIRVCVCVATVPVMITTKDLFEDSIHVSYEISGEKSIQTSLDKCPTRLRDNKDFFLSI